MAKARIVPRRYSPQFVWARAVGGPSRDVAPRLIAGCRINTFFLALALLLGAGCGGAPPCSMESDTGRRPRPRTPRPEQWRARTAYCETRPRSGPDREVRGSRRARGRSMIDLYRSWVTTCALEPSPCQGRVTWPCSSLRWRDARSTSASYAPPGSRRTVHRRSMPRRWQGTLPRAESTGQGEAILLPTLWPSIRLRRPPEPMPPPKTPILHHPPMLRADGRVTCLGSSDR
jgi:hypothetical protein